MPLPIFPTESGAPGDGNLIAVHGGLPAATEVLGGLIQMAQVIESVPSPGISIPVSHGFEGEALTTNGVTIWIRGSLNLTIHGEPTVSDYADILARWGTVRAKLLQTGYELFLYYRTAAPATFRKYKLVNTTLLRSYWNNPVTLSYTLAAVTNDKTLYSTAPGL
jgi:hypothetical protein